MYKYKFQDMTHVLLLIINIYLLLIKSITKQK